MKSAFSLGFISSGMIPVMSTSRRRSCLGFRFSARYPLLTSRSASSMGGLRNSLIMIFSISSCWRVTLMPLKPPSLFFRFSRCLRGEVMAWLRCERGFGGDMCGFSRRRRPAASGFVSGRPFSVECSCSRFHMPGRREYAARVSARSFQKVWSGVFVSLVIFSISVERVLEYFLYASVRMFPSSSSQKRQQRLVRWHAWLMMGMARRRMLYGGMALRRMPNPIWREFFWCWGFVPSSCVSRLSTWFQGFSVWKVEVGSMVSGASCAARSGVMPMWRLCMVLMME